MNEILEYVMAVVDRTVSDDFTTAIIMSYLGKQFIPITLGNISKSSENILDKREYMIVAIKMDGMWLNKNYFDDKISFHRCKVCGCDLFHSCEFGCHWVEKDLCSNCEGFYKSVQERFKKQPNCCKVLNEDGWVDSDIRSQLPKVMLSIEEDGKKGLYESLRWLAYSLIVIIACVLSVISFNQSGHSWMSYGLSCAVFFIFGFVFCAYSVEQEKGLRK